MMPPTSIDGTDITGATIDGTDVTEITVDGQTVFSAGIDVNAQLTDRWPLADGSGSIADNILGNVDLDINGNFSWVSGTQFTNGTAVELNDTNAFAISQSALDISLGAFTVMFWVKPFTEDVTFPQFSSLQNGNFAVTEAFDRRSWILRLIDFNVVASEGSWQMGEWYFVAYSGSAGDNWAFYIYDVNNQTLDRSGTDDYDNSAQKIILGSEVGSSIQGYYDDLMINQNTALSETTITDIWDETRQTKL